MQTGVDGECGPHLVYWFRGLLLVYTVCGLLLFWMVRKVNGLGLDSVFCRAHHCLVMDAKFVKKQGGAPFVKLHHCLVMDAKFVKKQGGPHL